MRKNPTPPLLTPLYAMLFVGTFTQNSVEGADPGALYLFVAVFVGLAIVLMLSYLADKKNGK